MRLASFATLTAALALVAGSLAPAVAAEPCPSAIGSTNNPAFGARADCPAKTVTKPGSIAGPLQPKSANAPVKQDGKWVYTNGDTTIAVGGSISGEVVTGKTTVNRP